VSVHGSDQQGYTRPDMRFNNAHLLSFLIKVSAQLGRCVSKRRDRADTLGKCRHWVKTKNAAHPAYSRVRDQLLFTRSRKSRVKP